MTSFQKEMGHLIRESQRINQGEQVAASIVSMYGSSFIIGIIFAWLDHVRNQLIDPVNQGEVLLYIIIIIMISARLHYEIMKLKNPNYELLQVWLQDLIQTVGTILTWGFGAILVSFFGEALNSTERFITLIFVVRTMTTILVYTAKRSEKILSKATEKKSE